MITVLLKMQTSKSNVRLSFMLQKQVIRFLLIGIIVTIVDYSVYQLLLLIFDSFAVPKGIGFIIGTLLAYLLNRRYTFSSRRNIGSSINSFFFLYLISLLVNTFLNSLVLSLFENDTVTIHLAFVIATIASATINFIGMKFYVFKE